MFFKMVRKIQIFCFICIFLFVFNLSCSKQNNQFYKGRICLVIDDFGYALNDTIYNFLNLDSAITVAIIPGTIYAEKINFLADSLGIPSIVHMPMEPNNYDEQSDKEYILRPGQNSLTINHRIQQAFQELPHAKGMNNHQGSFATEDIQLMKDVARSLKQKNKYFLDSFTNPDSRAFITMRRYGVKTELRQIFLDHVESKNNIRKQLDSLAKLSEIMTVAIGIGHVKNLTYEVLKTEIPRLKKEGYSFVRLEDVVR